MPAKAVRSAVKRFQIKYQIINKLISIALQDAEPIIFDYHVRQGSYAWRDVAKKFNAAAGNHHLRRMLDSIIPHYCMASGTYYPIREVEDVLNCLEHYHIKKYKDKFYYLEGGREDFYITNYFTISEFRQAFNLKYKNECELKLKLQNFVTAK